MKIGIITFHASFNYGSMLQAWALQGFLAQQGHTVEIINFRTKNQKRIYSRPIRFGNLDSTKRSIKRILMAPGTIVPLNRKFDLFDKFLHNNLQITKEFSSNEELSNYPFDYDYLITGSDQIWNTSASDFEEAYFGTFFNGIKIAYAPSMGPTPEKLDKLYIKSLLKDYKAVSVREIRTKEFIERNNIFNPVALVCDPTMLIDPNSYDSICQGKPLVKGDYLFYYTPGGVRHEFLSVASEMGKRLGLPVVCESLYSPGDLKRYDNVTPYAEVGPSEFLNLVKNAKVVAGASFHLMVFSILFHKDFYCLNGDVDSRMNNLMRIAGTENRIWSILSGKNNQWDSPLHYDDIDKNINLLIKTSKEFLINNIA